MDGKRMLLSIVAGTLLVYVVTIAFAHVTHLALEALGLDRRWILLLAPFMAMAIMALVYKPVDALAKWGTKT